MAGCALAYFAHGCWREGLRVRGNSIVVRDATGTSVVNFDDISAVGTGARGPHLPPEVMLTLRSGRRVFVGGKWWWHDRAKRYAKGPLEMGETDLEALAWRPGLWSPAHFARPRLVAVSLVLLACATCFVPFTIAAAGAWPGAADVLLRTILFLPVGGLVGFLTFVLLSVCRPYVPADANQVRGRSATSRTPAQRH